MAYVFLIFGVVIFLAGAVLGIFILLIVSIHRTGLGRVSESHGKPPGAIARRVLTGIRNDETETGE
jgi:hypothetical protein